MRYIFILTTFLYLSCDRANYFAAQKSEILQYQLENVDTLLDIGCSNGYFDRQIFEYYPDVFFVLEDLPNLVYHSKKGQTVINETYPTITEVGKVFKNSKRYPGIENRFKLIIGFEDSIPLPSNAFERILCRRTLHEFKNMDKMLSEIKRILKPNGKVTIVEVLSKYSGEQDPACGNLYLTKEEIKRMLMPLRFDSESTAVYRTEELSILTFTK